MSDGLGSAKLQLVRFLCKLVAKGFLLPHYSLHSSQHFIVNPVLDTKHKIILFSFDTYLLSNSFLGDQNRSPYAIGPLSCLSCL